VFNHHYSLGALFVILFFVGTHQGDPLIRPLFALVHFHTNLHCSSRVFPPLADDTHIFGLAHVISFVFDHFFFSWLLWGCLFNPASARFASFSLPLGFIAPTKFYLPHDGIVILGVPFGYTSFTSSFLQEVLIEDVWHANVFPRLKDVQVAFGILFRCFS
jgi:hypothetical protein